MSYRDDLDALSARHAALDGEVSEKSKERDQVASLLEDAKARAKLPVLPNIRVATPCRADWNQMVGTDRVRHCGSCDKDVFNLSAMTRDEAEALIVATKGDLCARYYQRHDGTIILQDCSVGVAQKRKRRVIAAGAAGLLAMGGAAAWFAKQHDRHEAIMGDVAIDPSYEQVRMSVHAEALDDSPPPAPPVAPKIEEPEIGPTMGAVAISPELREQLDKQQEPVETQVIK